MDFRNINLEDFEVSLVKSKTNDSFQLVFKMTKEAEQREKTENHKKTESSPYKYFSSEVQTVYKKSNGEIFVKKTKNRPINPNGNSYKHDTWYLKPGMINCYGHEVVDSYEQYYYDFKI